jgi:hypothetical protein
MGRTFIAAVMGACAIAFAALGVVFLFAPAETAVVLGAPAVATPFLQVLGGAYLGYAVLDWLTRNSLLGGIYGRPVVAANQLHFTVGALTLGKYAVTVPSALSLAFWLLAGFYVLGAVFFNWLAFGPGVASGG